MDLQNNFPYFCTIGNGMETFCLKELNKIKNISVMKVIIGKVFFRTSCDPLTLMSLKSVERLFVTVFHSKQFLCTSKTKVAFLNLTNLIEKEINWQSCLNQWITFKEFSNEENDTCVSNLRQSISHLTNNYNFGTESTEPAPKRKCPECLGFRVSCKSTGIVRKHFNSQKLSQFVGCLLTNVCGWRTDLKNPQLEVYIHASEEYFTVGFPVISKPLSQRNYLNHIALRSTVCYAMLLSLGDLPNGYILLDPMCGAGTLITEAAVNYPDILIFGIDIDFSQLKKAHENVYGANCSSKVELFHADVTNLPMKNESINAIICDFPFGNKFGTPEDVKKLLPLAIKEMNRVLTVRGKVILLVNEALKNFLLDTISDLKNINSLIINDSDKGNAPPQLHEGHHNPHEMDMVVSTDTTLLTHVTENSKLVFPHDHGANLTTQWKNEENHTIKLGKMIASICVFEKEHCAENQIDAVSLSQ